jgi:hypothetical protein
MGDDGLGLVVKAAANIGDVRLQQAASLAENDRQFTKLGRLKNGQERPQ